LKKKPKLNKRTLRNLKLKLTKLSDRKVAPAMAFITAPSNGSSC